MATASVDTVIKTVTSEVDEEMVQLTLSLMEANVIKAMTAFVGGDPNTTYRKDIAAVRRALTVAGVSGFSTEYFSRDSNGRITAKSYDD